MRKSLSVEDAVKFHNAVNAIADNVGINPSIKLLDLVAPFPGSILVKIAVLSREIQVKLIDRIKEISEDELAELLLTFLLKNEAKDERFAYQKLRAETFARQGHLCAVEGCGEPCTNLHHINPPSIHPELYLESWNVIGVCFKHHKLISQQQKESVAYFKSKDR